MSESHQPIKGVPHGMDRDPDHYNELLWKRKLYKKRVEKNESKKANKQYFREKERVE